jgi:hypothetical protein
VPDAATWAVIISPTTTLLGGLGGYWLAGRNDEARDRRAAARESSSRRGALTERLEEERHTFQRDVLLELQDELLRLIRVTTLINFQDQKTLTELGELYQLPAELGDESRLVTGSVQRLRMRVLDPGLRQAAGDFVGLCSRDAVAVARMPKETALAELSRQYAQLATTYVALNELLGEHLRRELDRRVPTEGPVPEGAPPPRRPS